MIKIRHARKWKESWAQVNVDTKSVPAAFVLLPLLAVPQTQTAAATWKKQAREEGKAFARVLSCIEKQGPEFVFLDHEQYAEPLLAELVMLLPRP